MINEILPRTKSAQKLKPYSGEFPSYIREFDERARKAGLAVEYRDDGSKCWRYLHAFAAGEKRLIIESGLLEDNNVHWPSGERLPTRIALTLIDPTSAHQGKIHRLGPDWFVLCYCVPLPDSISSLAGGIERLTFDSGTDEEKIVFIGKKPDLIAHGIAPESLFPDEATEEGRLSNGLERRDSLGLGDWRDFLLEQTQRLSGSRWAYTKRPNLIARVKKEAEERDRYDFASTDDYKEWLARYLYQVTRGVLDAFGTTKTKSRHIYRLPAKTRSEIDELVQRIERVIDSCHLIVTKEDTRTSEEREAARLSATKAESDRGFQSFLGKLDLKGASGR